MTFLPVYSSLKMCLGFLNEEFTLIETLSVFQVGMANEFLTCESLFGVESQHLSEEVFFFSAEFRMSRVESPKAESRESRKIPEQQILGRVGQVSGRRRPHHFANAQQDLEVVNSVEKR